MVHSKNEKDGHILNPNDPLLRLAREYAANGRTFLEENVPGWLERARQSPTFDMLTITHNALAIACKGAELQGVLVSNTGDMYRLFPNVDLADKSYGFFTGEDGEIPDEYLQIAWEEIFGRGAILTAAA